MPITRTGEEMLARLNAVAEGDVLGFRSEVLLAWMPYEQARAFLRPDTTAEEWAAAIAIEGDPDRAAEGYLEFAVGKILDHRGISAGRSVDKLGEYAWLFGRDDVVAAMDAAPYEQYGAPKVKAFAVGMGWPWPAEEPELERMADGEYCTPDCEAGCGR